MDFSDALRAEAAQKFNNDLLAALAELRTMIVELQKQVAELKKK